MKLKIIALTLLAAGTGAVISAAAQKTSVLVKEENNELQEIENEIKLIVLFSGGKAYTVYEGKEKISELIDKYPQYKERLEKIAQDAWDKKPPVQQFENVPVQMHRPRYRYVETQHPANPAAQVPNPDFDALDPAL